METLNFHRSNLGGAFKRMNAVNNGPVYRRHTNTQKRSNFAAYKAARIPFARNHDAAFCATYGGEHSVDITAVFPSFDADPADPSSYDFAMTDEYILATLEAGTETFYRLGQKIEHGIKKYGVIPPKDFKKWAIIAEHIIRHYNEGWADGFHLNIRYWEIWNEPDGDLEKEDLQKHCTWCGTKEQFFDFFEVAAKHLKICFPNLSIGGPAVVGNAAWVRDFLAEMKKRDVPLDFFSWHIYCRTPGELTERAERFKSMMIEAGYGKAESILNEWNYVKGWTDEFLQSIETIIGIKGAAFAMACMAAAQHSSINMLMYYDARPTTFNGLFDFYTLRPLKGYYPFLWYGMFYGCEAEILCDHEVEDIYSLCGYTKDGKILSVITYYTDKDDAKDKELTIDFGKDGAYDIYLLDDEHDGTLLETTSALTFTMKPNTCLQIRER